MLNFEPENPGEETGKLSFREKYDCCIAKSSIKTDIYR